MPVFIGVLGWFESILQGVVISWTWRRNIGGREITAVTIVTVLNAPQFSLRSISIYLYNIVYI